MQDNQKYFVPSQEQRIQRIEEAYRHNLLGNGFYFLSNNRLDLDLTRIHSYIISNEIHDKRLAKVLGKSVITPVNIIFQADTIKNKSLINDTIFIGASPNIIKINITNPNADVLKFERVTK